MKKLIPYTFLSIVLITIFSNTLFANDGGKKNSYIKETIDVKLIGEGNVLITPIIPRFTKAYYEIEKSYDKVSFKTAFVLLTANESNLPPIQLKDKTNSKYNIVYYRLKTIEGKNVKYSEVKLISNRR